MSERMDVTILGRTIGTASGWDGDPGEWVCFYEFEPKAGIDLPKGDLGFNEIKGTFGLDDEDAQDAVTLLQTLPRDEPLPERS